MAVAVQEPTAGERSPRPRRRWERRHERARVALPVTVIDREARAVARLALDTRDLSLGGAFLESMLLFELDEELELEWELDGEMVRARGRVVRLSRRDPIGMGIAFTHMEERDRERLGVLLEKQART